MTKFLVGAASALLILLIWGLLSDTGFTLTIDGQPHTIKIGVRL